MSAGVGRCTPGYPTSAVAAAAVVVAGIHNVAARDTVVQACSILVGIRAAAARLAARTRPGSICRHFRGQAQAAVAIAAAGWVRACCRPVGRTARRSRSMCCSHLRRVRQEITKIRVYVFWENILTIVHRLVMYL